MPWLVVFRHLKRIDGPDADVKEKEGEHAAFSVQLAKEAFSGQRSAVSQKRGTKKSLQKPTADS